MSLTAGLQHDDVYFRTPSVTDLDANNGGQSYT